MDTLVELHDHMWRWTQKDKHHCNTPSFTNPVCGLPPDSYQRSPLHHIDSHTTQHTGLHFPSSIALTTHTQLILELISLSEALPMMGIALCCVWAAYTSTELIEVAAHAAEPPEAAVRASAPCMVVAPSNSCPAHHITVKGTVDEHCTCPVNDLYLFPDVTTVEPPEVAAFAAEPSEVSVVTTYESLSCPVTAMEAVCESSSCPVTAMEAICESLSCPVATMEAVYESLSCPVTAMEAVCESSSCPVTAMEAICESLSCPVAAMEAVYESSSCPVTTMEAVYESSSCPVTAKEAVYELPGCSVPATKATLEPFPCSEPAEEAIAEL